MSCKTRGVACTFDMGPTERKRRKRISTEGLDGQENTIGTEKEASISVPGTVSMDGR